MKQKTNPFRLRAFTAIILVLTGLGLPITGIVNHFYAFSEFTFARHAWMAAHNVLGVLFVLFAIWHAILNARILLRHCLKASHSMLRLSREALWACGLVTLLLGLAIGHCFW